MMNPPNLPSPQMGLPSAGIQPELYPAMPYAPVTVSPDEIPTAVYTRSLAFTPNGERDILKACNTFKLNTINHAKERKLNQERNYAYSTNQFFGDDLLPLPSSDEADRDANNDRPQVFIPIMLEQLLQIYAFIMIRMFPNDEDYFRVIAKKEEYAAYEDDLTDALKYLFKKNNIRDQIGRCVWNMLWSGQFVAFPTFELPRGWEWVAPAPNSPDYQIQPTNLDPRLIVEEINPIHLYLDPVTSTNPRWMTLGFKKQWEILNSPFTIESQKAKIRTMGGSTQPLTSQYQEGLPIAVYNQVNTTYIDSEKWQIHDTYYFPHIIVEEQDFYNVTVVVLENSLVSEFRPNVAFQDSQLVQCPWRFQTESNYGFGPADDMQGLQRGINMLYNYIYEAIARNGNKYAIQEGVDLKNLFGGISSILITPKGMPANQAVFPITSNHEELTVAQEFAGVLTGQMINVGGSQDPFQGAQAGMFKKTATEINVLQTNATSRVQESVEHVSIYVAEVLQKLSYLAAHLYKGPITVRIDDPKAAPILPNEQPGPQDIQAAQIQQQAAQQGVPAPAPSGPFFRQIDLGVLRSGEFVIEMTGVNAAQSKAAESQIFMELAQMASSNPEGTIMIESIIEKLASLNGVKDFAEIFDTFKQRFSEMQQQQAAQAQAQEAQKMQEGANLKANMQGAQSA